jgi:hypothetical protein
MGQILAILLALTAIVAKAETFTVVENSNPSLGQIRSGEVYHSYKLIEFNDWNGPEKEIVNLFSSYKEPDYEGKDGRRVVRIHKKLKVFIAKVSFIIDRPASSIDLESFIKDTKKLNELNQGLLVTLNEISPAEVTTYKNANLSYRNPPLPAHWCADNSPPNSPRKTLCISSDFRIDEIKHSDGTTSPGGYQTLFNILERSHGKDPGLRGESEVRVKTADDMKEDAATIKALTGIPTQPAAGLFQSLFYFTHFVQFVRIIGILQPHPDNPNRTVVTGYMAFGLEAEKLETNYGCAKLEDIIMSRACNFPEGIGAGLPIFTKVLSKKLATIVSQ